MNFCNPWTSLYFLRLVFDSKPYVSLVLLFLYESRATFGGCYAVVIKFLSREDQTGTLFLSLNKEDVLVQSCRDPVENKSAKSIILLKEC